MIPRGDGYFEVEAGAPAGALYRYRLDGDKERPDPASRAQPEGVHGSSQVVADDYTWSDAEWSGVSLERYVTYELHTGTFTSEGTFEAIIPHLERLARLGITAIEIMPVAQFPGTRNWGYDGVYPFAPQISYGGVNGLKRLVDACHAAGLAAVLDVVYNHLGPEGNYLWDYGPYFTDRYRTPWGDAVNFDGAESDHVRHYFIENALHWLREYHFDALRLDALHAIFDFSARTFLRELADAVHQERASARRPLYLIAESDLNDTRLIRPPAEGGFDLDAQWCDDFHHALHTLLTGESEGYYADFGHIEQLAKSYRAGYVYTGEYSRFRRRRHGNDTAGIGATKFVVFNQNHDQVGNRMLGERPLTLTDLERQKLAATATLMAPYLPMLFMGEEYGDPAPFLYFVSHGDPALVEAVRQGRTEEFEAFHEHGTPPDPQDEATYRRSVLDHDLRRHEPHQTLYQYYRELLSLRREHPGLAPPCSDDAFSVGVLDDARTLLLHRRTTNEELVVLLRFSAETGPVTLPLEGRWDKLLESSDPRWGGPKVHLPDRLGAGGAAPVELAPWGAVLLRRG
jgi:maltooligosyltrehalose trehalohydrolase